MRFRRIGFPLLAGAVLVLAPSSPLAAQQLECVAPDDVNASGQCVFKIPKDAGRRNIILRLTNQSGPVRDADVEFEFRGAAGSITPKAKTGPSGLVEAIWVGTPTTEGAVVVARAKMEAERVVVREIRIEAAAAPAAPLTLTPYSGLGQIWYEKRQLPRPVVVEVEGADAACTGAVVFFRPTTGGLASPDSVYATRETDPLTHRSACLARTYWKLAEGVGTQHLTATVRGQPASNTTVEARARLLPRIGAGLAATYFRSYDVPKVDTATNDTTPDKVEDNFLLRPTVSADFPLFRRVPGLRGVVGISLTSPDRDWYVGFSALQPFYGIPHEAMGVDVHLVAHLGRRRVLDDVGDCRAGIDCDSDEELLLLGGGLMFIVDGTSLLNTFTGVLKP